MARNTVVQAADRFRKSAEFAADITLDEMVANIVSVAIDAKRYRAYADDVEWYRIANEMCREAQGDNEPIVAAGIMAALSINTNWLRNADLFSDLYDWGIAPEELRTLPMVRDLVRRMWNGESPESVIGHMPKVSQFWQNIAGNWQLVTIDRHAADIARGYRDTKRKGLRVSEFAMYREAYVIAADILDMLPCECQAVTWCHWRRIHGISREFLGDLIG